MSARQTLGRGFDALIPKDLDPGLLAEDQGRIQNLLIQDVVPNPDQPRREFDKKQLLELTESIRKHGVIQPIIVVKHGGQYRIVAGERRWRAARAAQLKNIPAIVRSLKELEQVELALIENIQRVDLSPLEQALAVLKLQHQFNLTLEDIAQKLGKAPSTVSNLTRLLQLPDEAREVLRSGKISEGHARAILALRSKPELQRELLRSILNNNLTVRQAEEFVLNVRGTDKKQSLSNKASISDDLTKKLKTKVSIRQTAKGGQLIIDFGSSEQLDSLIDKLSK